MNVSKFFIDRPIFAGVLSALIFVAGLLALPALPISEYPEVTPPVVVVRAQYPGANPKVIAETVSAPIEEQINGVEVLYMQPGHADGLITFNVTFRLGTIRTRRSSWFRTGWRRPNRDCPRRFARSASPRSRARPTLPWWCICCRRTGATT